VLCPQGSGLWYEQTSEINAVDLAYSMLACSSRSRRLVRILELLQPSEPDKQEADEAIVVVYATPLGLSQCSQCGAADADTVLDAVPATEARPDAAHADADEDESEAESGDAETCDTIVGAGDTDGEEEDSLLEQLVDACREGDTGALAGLLAREDCPRSPEPLLMAVAWQQVEAVRALLAAGWDVTRRGAVLCPQGSGLWYEQTSEINAVDLTYSMLACSSRSRRLVRILELLGTALRAGDPKPPDGQSAPRPTHLLYLSDIPGLGSEPGVGKDYPADLYCTVGAKEPARDKHRRDCHSHNRSVAPGVLLW